MQPYLALLALPALALTGVAAAVAAPAPADLLVLMHGSGRIERYDPASGTHLGTLSGGLVAPNALLVGADGCLYVSTGVPGGHGTVERFEARTGRRLGAFIDIPAEKPGHLARATGMAWLEGDLLVASQGDGKVKRFDGKTGAWKADVASASPGGLTQIAMQGDRLFLADFAAPGLRVSDLAGGEALAALWTGEPGNAPWGLVFAADGRAFWSTNGNRILTEGGDRAKTNLLKEPISVQFTLSDGSRVNSSDLTTASEVAANRIRYTFSPTVGADAEWRLWLDGQDLRMSFALAGPAAATIVKAELLIPFDPRAMGTTVLAEEWGTEGAVRAPLIISALDMGQVRLRNDGPDPRLDCRFTGSRLHKRIDLRVEVLGPTTPQRSIVFAPARLAKPRPEVPDAEWARIRRGLISLLQITPFMKPHEDGSGWLGSPGGITGNNVISDPVSVNMDRNLQWLAGMGDQAVVMGIDLNRIARRTLEFWLNQRMNADGSLDYVLQTGNISADSKATR